MVEDGRLFRSATPGAWSPWPTRPCSRKSLKKWPGDELSVRQTEQLVKQLTRPAKEPKAPEARSLGVDYAAVAAKELGDKLGRRVKIVTGRRKSGWSWNTTA